MTDTPELPPENPDPTPESVAPMTPAQCAARLAELFPALFTPGQPKPVKLRIQADIQARAPGLFSKKVLSGFLHRHTTSNAYLKVLAAAAHRIDLDGAEAGEVAEEHRTAAQTELERRRGLSQARRVEAREAQRQAQRAARPAPRAGQEAGPRPGPRSGSRTDARSGPAKSSQRSAHSAEKAAEKAADPPRPAPPVLDAAAQQRQALLRAWETTTLTPANFLALKGLTQADLDADLALARADRERRGAAHAPAPDRGRRGPRGPGRGS